MPRAKPKQPQQLEMLDLSQDIRFEEPRKRINEGQDVSFFLTSKAYTDILTFLLQLNAAMFPRKDEDLKQTSGRPSLAVAGLLSLMEDLNSFLEEAPPDKGPRRFGNIAFKTWYSLLEERVDELLLKHLPRSITDLDFYQAEHSPRLELRAYLLGSFGSAQRLDYGSGHELSFLAFLACIWKLGSFQADDLLQEQKTLVEVVFSAYLDLIRRLIKTYSLEPAGSHGVWGLDDHSFIPYIFGSAQLSPAIIDAMHIPLEGSGSEAPDPSDVTKQMEVTRWREKNLYFGAIGFIYDVKNGPFWEHSPMLFDIAGVRAGWAKINKGMIKMYIAEVLSKFPVVQHFPFGTMFRWESDPNAPLPPSSASTSDPRQASTTERPTGMSNTAAPWASNGSTHANAMPSPMQAPWSAASQRIPVRQTTAPNGLPSREPPLMRNSAGAQAPPSTGGLLAPTKAPWAK